LGLPLTEAINDGTRDGYEYWYQWFERGMIIRAQRQNGNDVWTRLWQYSRDVLEGSGSWQDKGWVQH
jgi:hypothetical protein